MTVDLVVLSAVLLFAILGAVAGVARQIAQVVAMIAAYASARPLGALLAPRIAAGMNVPLFVGTVAATVLVFLAVMFVGRWVIAAVLRKLMAGEDPDDRSMDRTLGFLVGGGKAAFVCYLVLSGLTFVEDHVQVAGNRLGVAPKDSKVAGFTRRYNFFELTQFNAVKDVAAMARASSDPKRLKRLKADPAFLSLSKDPRFRKLLEDPQVKKAAERGDYGALLKSSSVIELLQDKDAMERLQTALQAAPG